jgi:hypothetical protein
MNNILQIAKNNGFPPHSNQADEQNHKTHHPPNNSKIKHTNGSYLHTTSD